MRVNVVNECVDVYTSIPHFDEVFGVSQLCVAHVNLVSGTISHFCILAGYCGM